MSELEESGGEEDVALAHFLPFPLSYPKLGSFSNYCHLTSLVYPSHSTSDHPPTSPAMGKVARWFRSFLGMEQTKDQRCQRQDQLPLPLPARCRQALELRQVLPGLGGGHRRRLGARLGRQLGGRVAQVRGRSSPTISFGSAAGRCAPRRRYRGGRRARPGCTTPT